MSNEEPFNLEKARWITPEEVEGARKSIEKKLGIKLPPKKGRPPTCHGMLVSFTICALIVAASPPAFADAVLVPTGDPAQDVPNIQAAANVGGTILLKARDGSGAPRVFDFGSNQRVLFFKDVTVLGETIDGAMTTIKGGSQPFMTRCAFDPSNGLCLSTPLRFVVRGIHFDANVFDGIRVLAGSYVEIRNNWFNNTIGGPIDVGTKGQGVWINGAFPNEDVRGTLVIADNRFENAYADLGYGIAMFGFAADATISNNVIRGANTAGMGIFYWDGRVTIEGNWIEPGPQTSPIDSAGNGIFMTQYGLSGVLGTALIQRNRVTCVNPYADGIVMAFGTHDSVITQNHVTMEGAAFSGISVGGDAQRTLVSANIIDGDGAYALGVVGYDYGVLVPNASNTFVGNNITGFSSGFADVYFDPTSTRTTLTGYSGNVIDLGIDNRITGYSRMNGSDPVGQSLRDAQLQRLQFAMEQAGTDVP